MSNPRALWTHGGGGGGGAVVSTFHTPKHLETRNRLLHCEGLTPSQPGPRKARRLETLEPLPSCAN